MSPSELANKTPKVSIGVPVYNAERYLRTALDSLLAQTYADFELLISDNASTDATEAIYREYATRDARIRYSRQPVNKGAAFNFNAVMRMATGEYFMWAAADDLRDPDFLRLAVAVLDSDPSCGLVFSDYRVKNLETGQTSLERVTMYNAPSPWKRYFVRLLSPCPSLIYGLQRLSELRKIPADDYDFFDVHFTHWYALNSIVKVIPLPLYIAGVKGQFLPDGQRVSVPGTAQAPKTGAELPIPSDGDGVASRIKPARKARFDTTRFFAEERKMLFRRVPIVHAIGLYALLRYFYFKNVRELHSIMSQAADNSVSS